MDRLTRIGSWAALAAAVVPPFLVANLVAAHARNVPWKDQWGLVPFMAAVSRGELELRMLGLQVNEHRIPLTLLVQGALARATRWDVRYESWANVVLAGLALLALIGLVRQTIGPASRGAAAASVLACSVLTFSLAGGINWTWGSLNATYLAALAAVLVAWQLGAWDGGWLRTLGLVVCATAGAASFGTGVILVVLLPLALLVYPSVSFERRIRPALVAASWAAVVIPIYFVGWQPRGAARPPIVHWYRVPDYAQYVVLYVGGGLGTTDRRVGLVTGLVLVGTLAASSVWLWMRRPALRPALVPWWLLAAYGLANGALTAFGRLDDGLATALLVRYLPTASFVMLGTMVLAILAASVLLRESPWAGVAAVAGVGIAVLVASPRFYDASVGGAARMSYLARQLETGAKCLPTCATAADVCLLRLCWSADVARRMCPIMAAARIGPFAP